MIAYLDSTKDEICIIGPSKLNELVMLIDTTYAVYSKMRSQTGGAVSFGVDIAH